MFQVTSSVMPDENGISYAFNGCLCRINECLEAYSSIVRMKSGLYACFVIGTVILNTNSVQSLAIGHCAWFRRLVSSDDSLYLTLLCLLCTWSSTRLLFGLICFPLFLIYQYTFLGRVLEELTVISFVLYCKKKRMLKRRAMFFYFGQLNNYKRL